jgi:hypothetical protein
MEVTMEEMKWETKFKPLTVKTSDGSLLNGRVNIRNFKRLSDFFRSSEDQFIVMVPPEDQPQKVIMINKNFIIWAESQD